MGCCLLRWCARSGVVVAVVAAGCASQDASSGQKSASSGSAHSDKDGGALGTREIELTSDTALRIGFGQHSKIRGRLLDHNGAAVSGERVAFALVGRPVDSAITSLDALSAADGTFGDTLIAGESDATFRVRLSNEGAYDTFVDVAVSNAGFGTLVVTASYGGDRVVQQRSVFAQAGVGCADAERMAGDPMATFADSQAQARLPALPAGTKYAVTAIAEGEAGTIVAQGCVDGVAVESDVETPVEIIFKDQALMPKGEFALTAELDTTLPASALGSVLRSAVEAAIVGDTPGQPAPPDAEGRFLLDSLDGALRSDDFKGNADLLALADAIAADRAQSMPDLTPDHALQGALEIASRGPLAAAASIATLSQADLEKMRVSGTLALGATIAAHPQRIAALPARAMADAVTIDLQMAKAKVTTQARFLPKKDALELSSVHFEAKLGALSAQVVRAVMSTQAPGRGAEIRGVLGCATLDKWLGAQSYPTASACAKDCLSAACERAAARLLGAAETALLAEDGARPWVTLSSTLALHDADGDLIAEELSSDTLSGEWEAASGGDHGDAVSGTLKATAPAKAQP